MSERITNTNADKSPNNSTNEHENFFTNADKPYGFIISGENNNIKK